MAVRRRGAVRKPKQQKVDADAVFKKSEDFILEADITLIGQPKLEERMVIKLDGLGKTFNGNWWVKKVVHEIGDGYITKATIARNSSDTTASKGSDDISQKNKPISGVPLAQVKEIKQVI